MNDKNLLKTIQKDTLNGKFAVAAFNFSNIDLLRGILKGAQKTNFPIIIAMSEGALDSMSEEIVAYAHGLIRESGVRAVLHLDHGKSLASVKRAIDIGIESVMIDGSHLQYADNVSLTADVCAYAHERGVLVEGELGAMGDTDDEVRGVAHFTDPSQVLDFVARTQVDSLAVSIGTKHGAYKYKGEVNLRLDIVAEIQRLCPTLPLVLHGASNVSAEAVDRFVAAGGELTNAKGNSNILHNVAQTNIYKVNVDTDLRLTYMTAVREYLNEHKDVIDMRRVSAYAVSEVSKVVIERIKSLQ